ncbi:hypothetical protein WR25_24577 [Diploscapter pachys]|uniref:BPTI/Kunitz inhibitor domain-containing protein n=1 Tax=Diploscapter pachys TaxID=2018661 RepID=A0A2A2LZE0_9BILA|nr:hypothetical protein WR25_24577 [Diploscapter pachys]
MLRFLFPCSLVTIIVALDSDPGPDIGPCTINNERGIKCTEYGFYEIVQCDAGSCYCVDVDSGAKAYDTVTASDYEPTQCDSQGKECFCVNVKTGQMIPGTKQDKNSDKPLNCSGKPPALFGGSRIPTVAVRGGGLLSGLGIQLKVPIGNQKCTLPKDAGVTCNEQIPLVKWYFDPDTFQCLAFEYKGCKGNDNRFHTKAMCFSSCVLSDYEGCAMHTLPFKDNKGRILRCGGNNSNANRANLVGITLKDDGCPEDYKCHIGGFSNFCCSTKPSGTISFLRLDEMSSALKPTCSNKKRPFQDGSTVAEMRLGKSCDDKFCPQGHTCESNKMFSYCCPF